MNIRQFFILAVCVSFYATAANKLAAQTLEAIVNQATGEVTLSVVGDPGAAINFDSYQLSSAFGVLAPGTPASDYSNWNSYQEVTNPGGLDPEGWFEAHNDTNNPANRFGLAEVRGLGTSTINLGAPVSLGNIYNTAAAFADEGFLADVDDLAFTYGVPSQFGGVTLTGTVSYINQAQAQQNNLVLNIGSDGTAEIENESQTSVNLIGYTIAASEGAAMMLNPSFSGIRGGDAAWDNANSTSDFLAETRQSGSTVLNPGDTISLGQIGPAGVVSAANLDFDFLITNAGFNAATTDGFEKDITVGGGFDGAEFLRLQREDPAGIPNWEANYGTGAATASVGAVPEPSAIALCVLGMIGLGATRRSK